MKSIKINEAQSMSTTVSPKNSYVVISIGDKEIFLASSCYVKSKKTTQFYRKNKIGANINLLDIPHGTQEDKPQNTLPLFSKAAIQIHENLKKYNKVLVNCNHGRSRSGTVIALYLMNYLSCTATESIDVVTQALKRRGFEGGIDISGGYHGTYGEWLRHYEKRNAKENFSPNIDKPLSCTTRSKKRSYDLCLFDMPPPKKMKESCTSYQESLTPIIYR